MIQLAYVVVGKLCAWWLLMYTVQLKL
jgi:hypothetical protein